MGCLYCGRDLHTACALSRSASSCCGRTSLCPASEGGDAVTHTTSPQTGSRGQHRDATGASHHLSQHRAGGRQAPTRSSNDSITPLDLDLETEQDGRIGRYKTADFKNAESTGRKRAAELYPLDRNADCEWRGLANVGGGKHPIIGCLNGKQSNRHHGPDKDTLNNANGNVHRICNRCHNIWHEHNDADYDPAFLHNPKPAELEELLQWDDRKTRPRAEVSRYHSYRGARTKMETENRERNDRAEED